MGAIRKTLSISTLGLVSWRSKKEKLRAANAKLEATQADLEEATEKQSLLRSRLDEAKHRVEAAKLDSLHEAKAARRAGRRDARRRIGTGRYVRATLRDTLEPVVDSGRDVRRATEKKARWFGRRSAASAAAAKASGTKLGHKAAESASEKLDAARKRAEDLTSA